MSAESLMVLQSQKPNFVFEDSAQEESIVTPFPQMITSIVTAPPSSNKMDGTKIDEPALTPQEMNIIDTNGNINDENLSGIGCNFLTIVEEEEED